MTKGAWGKGIEQLPRTALFSFGSALGLLMIASVGTLVLSDGRTSFGPSEARFVFAGNFILSFAFFFVRSLLRR